MPKRKGPRADVEYLLGVCRRVYAEGGVEALRYRNLDKRIYHLLYRHGITQGKLLRLLGVEQEFARAKELDARWTWPSLVEAVRPVVERSQSLPPAGWFQRNGRAAIVSAVYALGRSWDDLRREFGSYESSSFVNSRSGKRWRSHPEAALSNFLYARGIVHERGRKYPPSYARISGRKYGYYDLEFRAKDGRMIQVEVWGDKPNGHNADGYAKVRKQKLKFNERSRAFLGIEFRDCFDEVALTRILMKYIGVIQPHVFEKPHDRELPSTSWSNADELLEFCRKVAASLPEGKFPAEDWLRKRGRWSKRPGETYNTLAIYILKWVGGFRKLRKLLGQAEHSTRQWSRRSAIRAYGEVHSEYGLTTGQIRGKVRRGQLKLPELERRRITNVDAAVLKYVGSAHAVNQLLGIPTRKKARRRG